jgi:hypothetical protein
MQLHCIHKYHTESFEPLDIQTEQTKLHAAIECDTSLNHEVNKRNTTFKKTKFVITTCRFV